MAKEYLETLWRHWKEKEIMQLWEDFEVLEEIWQSLQLKLVGALYIKSYSWIWLDAPQHKYPSKALNSMDII